jgi:hypothetical protein
MSNYTYTRQCRIWNRIIADEVWEALIVAKMVMFCLKWFENMCAERRGGALFRRVVHMIE